MDKCLDNCENCLVKGLFYGVVNEVFFYNLSGFITTGGYINFTPSIKTFSLIINGMGILKWVTRKTLTGFCIEIYCC